MFDDYHLKELNFDNWDNLIKATLQLKHNVGCALPNFENIVTYLKTKAENGHFSEEDIKNANYALVLLNLWSSDFKFSKNVPFTNQLFTKVLELRNNNITTLVLYYLIEIYFFQYDLLKEQSPLLTKTIKAELAKKTKNNKDETLLIKHKHSSFLFDNTFATHEKISKNAVSTNTTLAKELLKYDLYQSDTGRFYEQIRYAYFIQYLYRHDLTDCQNILNEILKNDTYKKDYKDGWNVGHHVIHILLAKLEYHIFEIKKYQFAIDFIIKIAGDPRINKSNITYQTWWLVLREKDIALMKKCLSGFDLELFLEIYGEFAEKENNHDQKRMFFERKKFLQGMLMQNLIHETKLFIGSDMINYLKLHYKPQELPRYSKITNDPARAVIFMRYNTQLFTEGSFNCFFRAYPYIMEKTPWDTNKYEYTYNELNSELEHKYGYGNIFKKIHNGDWQSYIIQYLKKATSEKLNSKIFY